MKQVYFIFWLSIIVLLPNLSSGQALVTTPGTYMVMSGQTTLSLQDLDLLNGSLFFADSGLVRFYSHAPVTTIGGSGNLYLHDLSLISPAGLFALGHNATITGSVQLNEGPLHLQGHVLDLNTTGTLAFESDSSWVAEDSGYIRAFADLQQTPVNASPGNLGLTLYSPVALGPTTLYRSGIPQTLPTGGHSIARVFTLAPTTSHGLNAAVLFSYVTADLAGLTVPNLALWTSVDSTRTWELAGQDTAIAAAHWVIKSGLSQLQTLTLGDTLTTAPAFIPAVRVDSVNVYPNPSTGPFTLAITSPVEKTQIIHVYNASSSMVMARQVVCLKGENRFSWDISALPKGLYYIETDGPGSRTIVLYKR